MTGREQTRRDAEGYIAYAGAIDAERHFAEVCLALLTELEQRDDALRAICQTNDSGPWIEIYRAAGGGYEGLQAIATAALAAWENE